MKHPGASAGRHKARTARIALSVLSLAIAGAVVSACQRQAENVLPVKSRWALRADGSQWTTVTVPANLLARNGGFEERDVQPGSGNGRPGVHSALLIHALWPEMAGFDARNAREFGVRGGGRALTISLASPAMDVIAGEPFDALALQRQIAGDALETVCVPTGLPAPSNAECTRRPPGVERDEFGLHLLGRDYTAFPIDPALFPSQREIRERRHSDGSLESLITCMPDGAPADLQVVPHCSLYFLDAPLNALVEVRFRKTYLPEWQSIRQKVVALLSTLAKT